jgi:hypothetical protein
VVSQVLGLGPVDISGLGGEAADIDGDEGNSPGHDDGEGLQSVVLGMGDGGWPDLEGHVVPEGLEGHPLHARYLVVWLRRVRGKEVLVEEMENKEKEMQTKEKKTKEKEMATAHHPGTPPEEVRVVGGPRDPREEHGEV